MQTNRNSHMTHEYMVWNVEVISDLYNVCILNAISDLIKFMQEWKNIKGDHIHQEVGNQVNSLLSVASFYFYSKGCRKKQKTKNKKQLEKRTYCCDFFTADSMVVTLCKADIYSPAFLLFIAPDFPMFLYHLKFRWWRPIPTNIWYIKLQDEFRLETPTLRDAQFECVHMYMYFLSMGGGRAVNGTSHLQLGPPSVRA